MTWLGKYRVVAPGDLRTTRQLLPFVLGYVAWPFLSTSSLLRFMWVLACHAFAPLAAADRLSAAVSLSVSLSVVSCLSPLVLLPSSVFARPPSPLPSPSPVKHFVLRNQQEPENRSYSRSPVGHENGLVCRHFTERYDQASRLGWVAAFSRVR